LAKHEFGIIERFEENKWYCEYEPQKYNCISVDMYLLDKLIDNNRDEFMQIRTYACISTQPISGLEECGITLIPPKSLPQFSELVQKANIQLNSQQLCELDNKIKQAISKGKYMIHFGI